MTDKTDWFLERMLQKLTEMGEVVFELKNRVEDLQIALDQANHQLSAIYDKHFPPPLDDDWPN